MSNVMEDHDAQPPFFNHEDVYETIDAIPIGGVPWQSFTFTYDGPKPTVEVPTWMEAEYTIWFRDPHKLFLEMIKNPDFVDSIDYTPYRQYDEDGNRQYENFMSGVGHGSKLFVFVASSSFNIIRLTHFYLGLSRILLQKRQRTTEQCSFLLHSAVIKRQFPLQLVPTSFGLYTAQLVMSTTMCVERMAQVSFL